MLFLPSLETPSSFSYLTFICKSVCCLDLGETNPCCEELEDVYKLGSQNILGHF